MNKNNLYVRKNTGKLILKGITLKDGNRIEEYVFDYLNDIYVQNYKNNPNEIDSMIICFSDIMDKTFDVDSIVLIKEIKHIGNIKNWFTGEDEEICDEYYNMELCYTENYCSNSMVSEEIIAFKSKHSKTNNVKKEINSILNRRIAGNKNTGINSLSHVLKESYFELGSKLDQLQISMCGLFDKEKECDKL